MFQVFQVTEVIGNQVKLTAYHKPELLVSTRIREKYGFATIKVEKLNGHYEVSMNLNIQAENVYETQLNTLKGNYRPSDFHFPPNSNYKLEHITAWFYEVLEAFMMGIPAGTRVCVVGRTGELWLKKPAPAPKTFSKSTPKVDSSVLANGPWNRSRIK